MPIEILMPALSPTMTEGNLAKWTVKEGDKIKSGQVIAEIETDKATMEVEAVDEGTIGKIVVAAGTEGVKVNQLIALLLEEGEDKKVLETYKPKAAAAPKAEEKPAASAPTAAPAAAPAPTAAPSIAPSLSPNAAPAAAAIPMRGAGERVFASPLAKRVAASEGVDIGGVAGTGPHGRVVKDDVLKAKASGNLGRSGRVMRNPVEFTKIPNNNMRKVIARRLTESKQQVPHFYLTVECELNRLLDVRKEINTEAELAAGKEKKPAYKLSVNDLVIKAVALAMKKVPASNASWYDDAIVQYNNVDISVAVAIDGGLITPIVKNADQKSVITISNEMKDLAARARTGKLAPEEFQGGGFSISNLGMFGVSHFAAIVNPPQGCILAVGAGEDKAVVREGQMVIRNVMNVTLSVDHRVVDGAVGAEFLQAFKNYIERPSLLLI
ncbi:MAG: pyruvate dehydrogenase complex dihydrolipoamide acetyltransferase [Rickettsiales bacterium]|nr:pyruvate dehydrogenase complex dihydrolipoamide acetyltransferase [Rickettsiales bacterium]